MDGLVTGFGVLLLGFSMVSTTEGTSEGDCHPIPAQQFELFMDEVLYGELLIKKSLRSKHWDKFGKLPDVALPDLEKCRKELPQDLPEMIPTLKYGHCTAIYKLIKSERPVHTLLGPICEE